jgi:tRNA (cmo5U34)-methyltransferase
MRIEKNIEKEFNVFSKDYTSDMMGCVPHYSKLISVFTSCLPKKFIPKYILDLGCGNGNVTSKLLQLFPESNFTLLDASQEMIAICKARFKSSKVEYVNSYFNNYRFKSDYYNLITAGFSLHHCDSEEKKTLFKHIYKSLKKGGVFSFSDLMINKNKPEHSKLLKEWKTFVNRTFPDGEKWKWLMEHYNEFDKPDDYIDQIQWLKEAGFKIINLPFKEDYWINIQTVKS